MPYTWKQELCINFNPSDNCNALKTEFAKESTRPDMRPSLIIQWMKHIQKESSSVHYTYWQYVFWIICYNKSIILCNIAKITGYLSARDGMSSGCGWSNGLQYEG